MENCRFFIPEELHGRSFENNIVCDDFVTFSGTEIGLRLRHAIKMIFPCGGDIIDDASMWMSVDLYSGYKPRKIAFVVITMYW